ncbi:MULTISPECIES: delta(1)-pyrroline-2-carboxylate reductase family protein [Novacetimonas]|uniref:Delta(1)-pyrroline-2-carboxylate reductase family protein n=1 Tax=Novacetimonas hansenii TaxID=436 RepID=A0AAW5ETU4_NOVHA|nr:delta(1)-pyrroline-2-carboxylate reductase family protein [Novacetimonas hansenii]MCJ8354969.1 delta(1)-pyrroline-2-carboxylate reductase family protein [Novacetimonas hansenii]PYD73346.1 ornithine cyclodeaminase [Novacetimonas hansenii]
MKHYCATQTQALLPFPALVDMLARTVRDYAGGTIACPERTTVPTHDGGGVLMCMPAVGADLITTKLLTIFGANTALHLPAIQGTVTCADAHDGRFLFGLDGPTVTMRRTSAISMLAIRTFVHGHVRRVLVIGTGTQALAHVEALAALHPAIEVAIRGRTPDRAERFCTQHATDRLTLRPERAGAEDGFDVVITTTSSTTPIFDTPADARRLVIGVGAYRPDMAEIAPQVVRASQIYVDDPIGAPSEAGDILQAGVPWGDVRALAQAFDTPRDPARPVFFKSVGCAAWDLAACRVARDMQTRLSPEA